MHTAPYFTAFALLALALSIGVVRLRGRHQVSVGDGGVQDLLHASRAFGNFAEYAPLGLLFLFVLEFQQAPVWYLHLAGMTLLVGRISHAIAFTSAKSRGAHVRFRVVGMTLTWLSLSLSGIGIGAFALLNARV